MKHWITIAAFFALQAYADGEMAIGTQPCKSLGLDLVQFSVGERVVASIYMSTAELERATYTRGSEKGAVACRVIHIKAKQ